MPKYEYYKHKNMSYTQNYFGCIGEPVKIGFLEFCVYSILGYRTTKVPKGTSKTEVIVAAAIKSGAHPNSYRVEKIRERGFDE